VAIKNGRNVTVGRPSVGQGYEIENARTLSRTQALLATRGRRAGERSGTTGFEPKTLAASSKRLWKIYVEPSTHGTCAVLPLRAPQRKSASRKNTVPLVKSHRDDAQAGRVIGAAYSLDRIETAPAG